MPQVTHIHAMAGDAQEGEFPGEGVDEGEQEVEGDDAVDETGEDAARGDGVFFDELGEVV